MTDKEKVLHIFNKTLLSVKPQSFLKKHCRVEEGVLHVEGMGYDLHDFKNIYVFGSGKAAYTMAKEMEEILGDLIYKGLIVAPYDDGELQKIEVKIGSHPIPTQKSLDAAQALLEVMQECAKADLYIYLLSGGSSSLIELPIEPVTLEDMQSATSLMLSNNLAIDEINTVRKHLSKIKGGRLAAASQASGIALVISDVIDNSLESIGSGILYADTSTFEDAKKILVKKEIYFHMPDSVKEVIEKGLQNTKEESPFISLSRVSHHILASNRHALQEAEKSALSLGLSVKVLEASLSGEVNPMVEKILAFLQDTREECLILGGECSVKLSGNGKGGRNQHLALLMLERICDKGLEITFLSSGTDGVDGNSDATGAVVDKKSCLRAARLGLDLQTYKKNFESYNFLKQTDDLIISGATGTNVADMVILLKGESNG